MKKLVLLAVLFGCMGCEQTFSVSMYNTKERLWFKCTRWDGFGNPEVLAICDDAKECKKTCDVARAAKWD